MLYSLLSLRAEDTWSPRFQRPSSTQRALGRQYRLQGKASGNLGNRLLGHSGKPHVHSHWSLTVATDRMQIIPNMQPHVAHLTAFMRSPTWISPAVASDSADTLPGGTYDSHEQQKDSLIFNHRFTDEQIRKFKDDPEYHLQFRKKIENQLNGATDVFTAGSEMNEGARKMMKAEMERRIGPGNEDLKQRLIPTWPPGCRRLTPGDGYLEALVKPNVTRVFGEIEKITPTGLQTDEGQFHEVDIIVCATGFDVAFTPSFQLKGRGGLTIQNEWAKEPICYLGLAAPNFPNYFTCLGPRGPWGNGPLLPAIEVLCEYFIQAMVKMQQEQVKAMVVKTKPTIQFNEHVDEWMKTSVWKTGCRSWYKMGTVDGKAWLWPGGVSILLSFSRAFY